MTQKQNKYLAPTFIIPVAITSALAIAMLFTIVMILAAQKYVPLHEGTAIAKHIFKYGYIYITGFFWIMLASSVMVPLSLFMAVKHKKFYPQETALYQNMPVIATATLQIILVIGFFAIRL